MGLLTLAYVKQYFPRWNMFFLDGSNTASDTALQNELDLAEAEFSRYLDRTADTITADEKRQLLSIVVYRGFNRLHGDTDFETKPQIVKDYESAVEQLKRSAGSGISITANAKVFTGQEWFHSELNKEEE